jgi:hypothetical protein
MFKLNPESWYEKRLKITTNGKSEWRDKGENHLCSTNMTFCLFCFAKQFSHLLKIHSYPLTLGGNYNDMKFNQLLSINQEIIYSLNKTDGEFLRKIFNLNFSSSHWKKFSHITQQMSQKWFNTVILWAKMCHNSLPMHRSRASFVCIERKRWKKLPKIICMSFVEAFVYDWLSFRWGFVLHHFHKNKEKKMK